jgi:hypothetical protein
VIFYSDELHSGLHQSNTHKHAFLNDKNNTCSLTFNYFLHLQTETALASTTQEIKAILREGFMGSDTSSLLR